MLSTPRTKIRKAQIDDVDFIFKLLNEEGFLQFIGDRGIKQKEDAEKYIESAFFNSYATHGLCSPFIVSDIEGRAVGIAGFYHRPSMQCPDLGFAFLKEIEGQGYAFEACQEILSFAAESLKLKTVAGILMPSNQRSKSLLKRLGFKELGNIVINPNLEKVLLMHIDLSK
ncbi:GNAT family N-acetyltransferase [Pseudoalteromonas xiamenensis]